MYPILKGNVNSVIGRKRFGEKGNTSGNNIAVTRGAENRIPTIEACDNRFREPAAKEIQKYGIGNVKGSISTIFSFAIKETVPHLPDVVPLIVPCTNPRFGADYQCNNPMSLFRATNFKTPLALAQAIIQNLPHSDMIESCSLAGPGFINIKLTNQWMGMAIQNMLIGGIHKWAPTLPFKTAVVDFSSPNIAKEMHVGHLRSTIIGDTVARMLEFSNVNVLRRNHVGDWGTQFGMLIEFLFDKFPNQEANDQTIGELEAFYKAAKLRFDNDAAFKERAQHAVVKLQSGVEMYVKAWSQICEISRESYQKVYQRLGIYLEEKGESFYNPYIPDTLDVLRQKGLIKESQGAQVISIKGKEIPFIVVKRDGGFNYASTDLAALRYRLNVEKAELVIYVTDGSQREHFDMLFSTAELAGWLPTEKSKYPKASHVGFGLVCGDDGKRFRTRSTEVVRLVDLLDEAKSRCKATLVKRGKDAEWTAEELEHIAEAIGYGAVKYADLKNNRLINYTFNFDQMLNDKGNTAVYLLYAHARICSLIRNSGKHIEELTKNGQLVLKNDEERKLGLHLLQFAEVVEEACTQLLPNVLCEYLYDLSEKFNSFYFQHQVVGSSEETSRLLLCEATAVVMRKCFHILGITPVYKI